MEERSAGRRLAISKELQVRIFRRDGWICRWCGRPVVFAPVMKYLERLVRQRGFAGPLAYYHAHWTRRDAPLLDYTGAVIDHIQARSRGGADTAENFATACNKCNATKSNAGKDDFHRKSPRRPVKGKYGEPENWDGFSTLFVVLVEIAPEPSTVSERDWLRYLKVPFVTGPDQAHRQH
jgi:5-methylcytosine-specific restriction endonuclease McrA